MVFSSNQKFGINNNIDDLLIELQSEIDQAINNSAGSILTANATISNIVNNNITSASAIITNATISNIVNNNITSASAIINNAINTNITSSNANITNASIGNATVTNVRATNETVTNLLATNITSSNSTIVSGTFSNLLGTNLSAANLHVTTTLQAQNVTANNLITTNITSLNSTIVSGTFSNLLGTNLSAANAHITTTLVATNVTANNMRVGNETISNIFITSGLTTPNAVITNLVNTNETTTNLFATNVTSNNVYINNNIGIGGTTSNRLLVRGANAAACISATAEFGENATLFFGTPFNEPSPYKAAIIARGKGSNSRSALHFSLDNTANNDPAFSAQLSNTRMMIDSTGVVGIATTTPAHTLDVNGGIRATNITTTNILTTSVSSATLNLSTGITSANANITNVSSATLNLSTGITSANANITNITNTNLLSTNASAATLNSNRIQVSTNLTIGQLVINTPNIVNDFGSMGSLVVSNTTPSSNTALNDPQPILTLLRSGTSSQSWGPRVTLSLSRFTTGGVSPNTKLDFQLSTIDSAQTVIPLTILTNRIGINNTSPAHALDVNGGINSTSFTAPNALINNLSSSNLLSNFVGTNNIGTNNIETTNLTSTNILITNATISNAVINPTFTNGITVGNTLLSTVSGTFETRPNAVILGNHGQIVFGTPTTGSMALQNRAIFGVNTGSLGGDLFILGGGATVGSPSTPGRSVVIEDYVVVRPRANLAGDFGSGGRIHIGGFNSAYISSTNGNLRFEPGISSTGGSSNRTVQFNTDLLLNNTRTLSWIDANGVSGGNLGRLTENWGWLFNMQTQNPIKIVGAPLVLGSGYNISSATWNTGASLHTERAIIQGSTIGNVDAAIGLDIYNDSRFSQIYPRVDNAFSCARSGNRWSEVWSANGTIQTSDARYKKDVVDEVGLDFVRKLRPVQYKWDADKDGVITSHENRIKHGFLAQEIKKLVEENDDLVVVPDNDFEPMGLIYTEFISILTKAIQDLDDKMHRPFYLRVRNYFRKKIEKRRMLSRKTSWA